jgi:thiol-disulfide isomerase/thioredoxin
VNSDNQAFSRSDTLKKGTLLIVIAVIITSVMTAPVLLRVFQSEQQPDPEERWRIVNYWSEWCPPCRREIPMLNHLYQDLLTTNITVVGVNFDEDPREKSLAIAKGMGIEFPTLTRKTVLAMQLTSPDVLPTTYILSPENHVLAKMIGEQTKESLLARLASLNLPEQNTL